MTGGLPDIDRMAELLESGCDDGLYSGAALAVGTSDERRVRVVGEREEGGDPVTADTRFDLASLTKPVATTTVVARLVERGELALDATLGEHLDSVVDTPRESIPVRSLLTHTSGLPPYKSFPYGWDSRDALVESVADSPIGVLAPPGELHVYSGLNFVFLSELVRTITGGTLAAAFDRFVGSPLALDETAFGPLSGVPVAATRDRKWRERTLRGEIHDYMGAAADGESGNAGLFSTAGDLATVAQMLLNEGRHDGTQVLAPTTVERLSEDGNPELDARQGLGWRLGTETRPATGWSEDALGHTGFTGTSLWLDPTEDLFVVALTNRVLVTEETQALQRLRTRLHEIAAATGDDQRDDTDEQ
jgi:CubicO group peptidase (beta-lactamase class C family)